MRLAQKSVKSGEGMALAVAACLVFTVSARAETLHARSGGERGFCEILSRHTPRSDVIYNPRAADVPADLAPGPFALPDEIVFPLTVDLKEYFGTNVPGGVILEPDLGVFRIRNDGNVLWNDIDLTDEALSYCGLPPKPSKKPPAPEQAELRRPAPQEPLEEKGEALYGAYPE
ncbi:MAG: hypothetical protein EOM26_08795 [Alphaproteobacteria bacterium]|nr:hypothetical protein [Alphaproteobacteria bacterium]